MSSQVYNLLWISPKFAPQDEDSLPFYDPIPPETVQTMKMITGQNEKVDIQLWVDQKRLTQKQWDWLQEIFSEFPNLTVKNLREIPEYDQETFYNQEDTSFEWRVDRGSLIWKQVDAAKILVCKVGFDRGYREVIFSDADVTNIEVNSEEIRRFFTSESSGLFVGAFMPDGNPLLFENQAFGFDIRHRGFVEKLYEQTLYNCQPGVALRGENGWFIFEDSIYQLLRDNSISASSIAWQAGYDGTEAWFPQEHNPYRNSSWRK